MATLSEFLDAKSGYEAATEPLDKYEFALRAEWALRSIAARACASGEGAKMRILERNADSWHAIALAVKERRSA